MKTFLIVTVTLLSVALSACSDEGAKARNKDTVTEQLGSTGSNYASAPPVNENKPKLPPFTMQDIDGKTINLQSLKGKKVFVNLWASWCPPCRREMPSIEKLAKAVDK